MKKLLILKGFSQVDAENIVSEVQSLVSNADGGVIVIRLADEQSITEINLSDADVEVAPLIESHVCNGCCTIEKSNRPPGSN